MTIASPSPVGPDVAGNILDPLNQLAGRHWALRIAQGVLQALSAILLGWLLIVLMQGMFPGMPLLLRVTLSLLAWALFIGASVYFLRPAVHRTSAAAAARQVEDAMPQVHERISSAVELSAEEDDRYRGSQELVTHLVYQAQDDVAALEPGAIVSTKSVVRWAIICAPLALAWIILLPTAPRAMRDGMLRTFAPWSRLATARDAGMIIAPGNATIAQGDTLAVHVKVKRDGRKRLLVRNAVLITEYSDAQRIHTRMRRTSLRAFRTFVSNVRQGFLYRIKTPLGTSSWYHVRVLPRPAISGLTIKYTFPRYTHLPKKVRANATGAIRAVVGTQVQVIVQTTQKLAPGSDLVLGKGTPFMRRLPLTSAKPGNFYQATFSIDRDEDYRIALMDHDGLKNKERQPHRIIALADPPPIVRIISPKPTIQVRPDDLVPVEYKARDGYGLSRVRAVVQVDGQPPQTIRVPTELPLRKRFTGHFRLNVRKLIKAAKIANAQTIYYTLRVADNHRPAVQWGASARQELVINRALAETYSQRHDRHVATALAAALKQQLQEVKAAEASAKKIAHINNNRVLTATERHKTNLLKRSLAAQSKALAAAAKKARFSAYSRVAKQARHTARHSVRSAASQMAKVAMNADRPGQRRAAANSAAKALAKAGRQLRKELNNLKKAAMRRQVRYALHSAVGKQRQAANGKTPAQQRAQQLAARQALKKMIAQNKQLQKPEQVKQQIQVDHLIMQLLAIVRNQGGVLQQLKAQFKVKSVVASFQALATQQQQFNTATQQFFQSQQPLMQASHARAANANQMATAVRALQNAQFQVALTNTLAVANQLRTAAAHFARQSNPAQNPAQRRMLHVSQATQNVVRQITAKLAALQAPGNKSTPAKKALSFRKLINIVSNRKRILLITGVTPQQRQQLTAMAAQIGAANLATSRMQFPQVAQSLTQCANTLQAVALATQTTATQQSQVQKNAAAASARAAALSAQEQGLRGSLAVLARQYNRFNGAHSPVPAVVAARQHNISMSIGKADAHAQTIIAKAKAGAPALAQKVTEAEQYIHAGHDQEHIARAAELSNNVPMAQERQQDSQGKIKRAIVILLERFRNPQLTQHGFHHQYPNPANHNQPNPTQQNPNQPPPQNQQQQQQQQQQEAQHSSAQQLQQLATAQSRHDQQANQAMQQAVQQGMQQAGDQGQRNQPQPGQQNPGNNPGQQNQGNNPGQNQQNPHNGMTPEQKQLMAAAAALQKALAQQSQALAGKSGAAKQALHSMQAAQKMFAHMAGGQHAGQGQEPGQEAGNEPGHGQEPGQGQGQGQGQGHGSEPGHGQQPGTGIAQAGQPGSGNAGNNPMQATGIQQHSTPGQGNVPNVQGAVPKSVASLGISPADWALLGKRRQNDLLNAAQQGGPASYRRMIKDYYVRIARMEANGGGQ